MDKELESIKGLFNEYGLKGNHNLTGKRIGIIHVHANYGAEKDEVFIKVNNDNGWQRVKEKDANKRDIIRCTYCTKYAVSIDHSYPWQRESTVCKEHHKKLKENGFDYRCLEDGV